MILSPHRDDAIFSLAHALRHWSILSIPLRVINVFTISNYAPRAVIRGCNSVGVVSDLRKREDRRAIQRVARDCEQCDLDLLDAPLQYDVGSFAVSGPDAVAAAENDVNQLIRVLSPLLPASRVVAPLGLGNHVNHLAVKHAAMRCVPPKRLAFYEDLPYATWAAEHEWQIRLEEANCNGTVSLRPVRIHTTTSVRWKRQSARLYQTQIGDSDAAKIADFARFRVAGERLWVPPHSSDWNSP